MRFRSFNPRSSAVGRAPIAVVRASQIPAEEAPRRRSRTTAYHEPGPARSDGAASPKLRAIDLQEHNATGEGKTMRATSPATGVAGRAARSAKGSGCVTDEPGMSRGSTARIVRAQRSSCRNSSVEATTRRTYGRPGRRDGDLRSLARAARRRSRSRRRGGRRRPRSRRSRQVARRSAMVEPKHGVARPSAQADEHARAGNDNRSPAPTSCDQKPVAATPR